MASNLAGFRPRRLGYQGQAAGPSDLLIWLTMTDQLGRWLTAGAQLSAVVHGTQSGSCLPIDWNRWRSWLIRFDDRDPIEANSLLPRHVAVAVP